tara:strand:+ start:424 stop:858 length:435 start_codon:yes stop_codon:yes gene_type:complete
MTDYKALYEKEKKKNDTFKKVIKKQRQNTNNLKEKIEELEEELTYNDNEVIKVAERNKQVRSENKKLKEEIKQYKKELLKASLYGFIEGCSDGSDGLSIDGEIQFLNQSGESQELIKEVFDEMYNDINLVYNIKTKDYEEIEEQ